MSRLSRWLTSRKLNCVTGWRTAARGWMQSKQMKIVCLVRIKYACCGMNSNVVASKADAAMEGASDAAIRSRHFGETDEERSRRWEIGTARLWTKGRDRARCPERGDCGRARCGQARDQSRSDGSDR